MITKFLVTAWAWSKKNWRWILFPFGILMLILGWSRKTNVTVVSPVLEGADAEQAKLDEAAAEAQAKLAEKRDTAVATAVAEEDSNIKAVTVDQTAKSPELLKDEAALNSELLKVDKDQKS